MKIFEKYYHQAHFDSFNQGLRLVKKNNSFKLRIKVFRKLFVFFIIVFFVSQSAYSQQLEDDYSDQLENFIESVFSENESVDVQQLLDELQLKMSNPYNANEVTASELASLYILNQSQINSLLKYREQYGQILSAYELMAINGLDQNIIQFLSHFLVFEPVSKEKTSTYTEHEVLMREIRLLEKQAAFKDPKKYEGSQDKLYLRYRFTSSIVQAGFTGEKDAGESFFKESNACGFDFYSGYVSLDFGEEKPKIYLGDYVVQFGQGLAVWQGFSLGKSSEVSQVAKLNQGLKSYTSTDENNYQRGIAGSFQWGKLKFTPFLSFKNFDANTDSIENEKVFTSFQTSGYHRTASEIEDKNSVSEFVSGANINYEGGDFSVGLTGVNFNYQYPLDRSNSSYNDYLFEGDHISNLSVDYKWAINNVFLYGEFASSFDKGIAAITGVLVQPKDWIDLSAVYRNIGKRYNAPLASALLENSRVNDEEGFYVGATIYPAPKLTLKMYADFFKWKWIKYTTAAAGSGEEYLMKASYTPNEKWETYLQYKYEIKPVKVTNDDLRYNLDQVRQSLRFQVKGEIGENFISKTRAEFSFYEHDHNSSGVFFSQDIGYQPEKFSIWARIAWFKTDDYDSRIYAWENDMLYQFSIPSFYGKGLRYYLSGKVKICEKTDLWFKASRSWFYDNDSIGSGYSMIDGNKRTELKIQLRFRF